MTSTAPGGAQPGGRRRIDRVLAGDYLTGLVDLPLDDLRARRHEAEQEEADLSYVRRMLQGRMDILRAELARRAGGATGSDEKIVERLSEVLTDPAGRIDRGLGRYLRVEPSRVDEHRRGVEQIIADVGVSDVDGHSDEDVQDALRRLEGFERTVSEDRRAVQQVMDALTAEVAARYKSGAASVDDLLVEG
jgi:hypothetical protein